MKSGCRMWSDMQTENYYTIHLYCIIYRSNDGTITANCFVWREEQVVRLFDSLLRGYPIGTFLFWTTKSHVARRRMFFQNYYRKYSKDFNIEKLGLEDATTRDNVVLVLDGQQRLQALYLATSGIYEGKELFQEGTTKKRGYVVGESERYGQQVS
jgi:hypothetical protein